MPIPPRVDHGFDNLSDEDHLIPFVFGSRRLGGWGLFADVEPRPRPAESFAEAPLEAEPMNGSVYIERAIEAAATWAGADLTGDTFRILSIRRGRGRLRLGPVARDLSPHDHVGLPAGLAAHLTPLGDEPLVLLESTIEPATSE